MKQYLIATGLTTSLLAYGISANADGSASAQVLIPQASVSAAYDTAINFGSFYAGTANGTVSLPETGARTLTAVTASASGDDSVRGAITLTGPAAAVLESVAIPNSVTLAGPDSNTMTYTPKIGLSVAQTGSSVSTDKQTISNITFPASTSSTTSTVGLVVYGDLAVSANQAAGAYTGTYTVTFNGG